MIRALGRDDEVGQPADSIAGKQVRSGLDVQPLALGGPAVTNGPRSVAAADLDADGDRDIVSANRDGNDLTVFFQTEPGSFQAPPLVLGGPGMTNGPRSVTAADLDSDGDQDLVSANLDGSNLTVFSQIAPGSFQASPLVIGRPGALPRTVAVADLDSDGDQDLVSANFGSSNLTAFFQLSPGNFAVTPSLVLATATPRSVVAADLDADGDQDLVSANQSDPDFFVDPVDNLTVFFQLAPGSFAASPLVLGNSVLMSRPFSVAAADLDGDGNQDLVSANQGSNSLTVFFQLSPGSFATRPLTLGGLPVMLGPTWVATADLDGDGRRDLVSANESGDDLTVFVQDSPGEFGSIPVFIGGLGTTDSPRSVAAADLDGDGDRDLVTTNSSGFLNTTKLLVFMQLQSRTFAATPLVLGGSGTTQFPFSVTAADLDGDGDQDVVSANQNGIAVFPQTSPGSFVLDPLIVGGFPHGSVSVVPADLDGDGDQDLVANGLEIFFQLLPGSFAETPLDLGGGASVAAADLDGDGDMDLVSENHDGNMTVYYQLSPGSFGTTPLVLGGPGTTNGPSSIAVADLDGDGDQDLVSANREASNLTVYFQPSPGTFAETALVLGGPGTTSGPSSIAAADLDGDGDQDLVSANANGLTVFFQRSPGSIGPAPLVVGAGTTQFSVSLSAADLDSDGDVDLVSANNSGNNLTLFWGGR